VDYCPVWSQGMATHSVVASAVKVISSFSLTVVSWGGEASKPAKVATWRAFEVPWECESLSLVAPRSI
jgi:hypothetical protein